MNPSTREQARGDGHDNRRAFRWGAVVVVVLVAGALGYNLMSHERAGPLNPETPAVQQRAEPAAPPSGAQGGTNGAAGPGTGAGTSTGASTGTGANAGTGAPRN